MSLNDHVSALIRGVAAQVVTPRFRMLAQNDIAQKSKGEIVTIVDREAERRLHDGLAALGMGARIVGEEAAEQDPQLLSGIGSGLVWLIDPLDGTANFAAGQEPFGVMIALVDNGVPIAGWMFDPLSGRLCHAERGKGATCNGEQVRARPSGALPPVAALGTQFLGAETRERVHEIAAQHLTLVPIPRCAAASYPRMVLGDNDIAMFQRILPWDHAAGALFLTEAGGTVTHWDHSPYRVGGGGSGVLCAANERLWQFAADLLLAPAAGLFEMGITAS